MITAERPSHECREYMFGMGGLARLCESNTVFRAITVRTKAAKWMPAWVSFSVFLRVVRKPR